MDKRDAIYDDFLKMFLMYVHGSEIVPTCAADFFEAEKRAEERFRNEPVFHAKVQNLTMLAMRIVEKHFADNL